MTGKNSPSKAREPAMFKEITEALDYAVRLLLCSNYELRIRPSYVLAPEAGR